jgi:hypothetical protein
MKYMVLEVTEGQSSDQKDTVPYSDECNDTHASRFADVTVCKRQENISAQ